MPIDSYGGRPHPSISNLSVHSQECGSLALEPHTAKPYIFLDDLAHARRYVRNERELSDELGGVQREVRKE